MPPDPTSSWLHSLPVISGPSRFGSHFIGDWWACPYAWALGRVACGTGLTPPHKPKPMLLGIEVHRGLEIYHSWTPPNLDLAIEAASIKNSSHSYADPADQAAAHDQGALLLTQYHDHWGPKDELTTLTLAGQPLVEYELSMPLGYRDFIYTARLDWVATDPLAQVYPVDHKTVDASRRVSQIDELIWSAQVTGIVMLCQHNHPEWHVDTLIGDLLIKRAAKDKDKCERAYAYREAAHIDKFRLDATRTLAQIDSALDLYHQLREPMGEWGALLQAFTKQPSYTCGRCEYGPLCANPSEASRFAADLVPASQVSEENPE